MLDELERDLDRVRAYRADAPEPDAATVAAARTQLMQAIAAALRAGGAGRRSRPTRDRLRSLQRRRRLALAGVLSTAGVGVAGVLGLTTAATPVSALAAQMHQLAQVAAGQGWTGIPGPGQYLYTGSQGLTETDVMGNDQECAISQVEHRQIWIATDGSGALSDIRDQSKFTSAADQATCASAFKITDPSSQDSSSNSRFPAGGLSFPTNDWQSLSTDPATLLKQIHARDGGPDNPAELFTNVGDYMREADVPPAIRAALYNAAALIPGVKLLGTQTDPTGQAGLGVGYPYDNGQIHSELIFDQQTGRLLAEEYFDQTGRLVDWNAYTSQKIVGSVPDYPMQANQENAATSQLSGSATDAAGTQPASATTSTTPGAGTASTPAQAPATITTGS
jgi:RNA polymerase sigma-70 factor (ECF subfamily)